jgi:acyl-coenzyme A synthetase/AMP-(fatty) acid ligase/3-oxoacyl-(acyl-carrier-protein) synthase/NADPH:quinone reductase-like Zn-dependent oxidoreductase/acyl carrier protein
VARAEGLLLAAAPRNLASEEACTLPTVWSTVHVAVGWKGLRSAQYALLHAAAGGVGLVGVDYTQWLGANVLGSAGKPQKHRVLRNQRVTSLASRDGSALARGLTRTLGSRRLHLVLNSLSNDFISASLAACGESASFAEIGKRGIWSERRHAAAVRGSSAYRAIAVDHDWVAAPHWMQGVLCVLSRRAQSNVARALPFQSVGLEHELERAFRILQAGANLGKVVVRVAKRDMSLPPATPSSEVITGGTGGLGLLIGRWLAERGSQMIVLASRSGKMGSAAPNEQSMLLATRASVEVMRGDSAESSATRRLLAATAQLAPLRGVWHAAGVLSDGLLAKHNSQTLTHVYGPKAHGSFLLQRATAAAPLERSLAFSSVVALLGGAGQSNYSAANCCLDAQAAYRRASGRVGTAVQWGPWGEVGMASGAKIGHRFEASGLLLIGLAQGLRAVQAAVQLDRPPVVGCVPADWGTIVRNEPVVPAFLSAVAKKAKPAAAEGHSRSGGRSGGGRGKSSRADASASGENEVLTVAAIQQMVARTVGSDCDLDVPLVEVGLDSLGSVELTNLLQGALGKGVPMPTTLVFDHPTTRALFSFVEKTLEALGGSRAAQPAVSQSGAAPAQPAAAAEEKAPSPIAAVQLLQLPGLDGSFFQFRALEAAFEGFDVQVQPISMETLEDAQSSKEVLGDFIDEDMVVVMGYSAGAGLVPSFVRWMHHAGTKVDAVIIMDPPISEATLPVDLGHRLIATSVLGDANIPDELDVDMLERALVSSFPSYASRFASARKFLSMLPAARDDDAEPENAKLEKEIQLPTLLMISTVDHPEATGIVGGSGAEAEWHARYPHAEVQYVNSDHIRVPYAQDTAPIVLDFLFSLLDERCKPREMEDACKAFTETAAQMEGAQDAFKSTWSQSKYSAVDFARVPEDTVTLKADSQAAYMRIHLRDEVSHWQPIAMQVLHWHHEAPDAWVSYSTEGSDQPRWAGWSATSLEPTTLPAEWRPWTSVVDHSEAPYVRWFVGARTNAAFNELDRFVLQGLGSEVTLIAEPEKGDAYSVRRSDMLRQSVLVAHCMRTNLELTQGSRVAFLLPNGPTAVVWIEAAKRSAIVFCAVAAGTAANSVASRLTDTLASYLIISENVLSIAETAIGIASETAQIRGVLAEPEVLSAPAPEGWLVASELLAPLQSLIPLPSESDADTFMRSCWSLVPPVAVDASYPLFALYTSGSTGKPKGIVHTHGGYHVGLIATTAIVFDTKPGQDVLFVVATPGWITGQSYMISASLLSRTPSVLLDGSPVSPPDRFAAIIARHKVTVLKAGSTFLRMLMTREGSEEQLAKHDLTSLRIGTFCAEPVNEAVHRFASLRLTKNYINSYWATEHGGMVWSRCAGNADQPVQADTRSWPLPWIQGETMVPKLNFEEEIESWRRAADGEQGEVVVRRQYPYMALTVWAAEGFGSPGWRGDLKRWAKYFSGKAGYVQGDAAIRHSDGGFTFHGRSDEVINVGGNRIGTEEIENAILLDRDREGSPVLNCAVVGMKDAMLGTAPCAFLILRAGATLQPMDEGKLCSLVQSRLGGHAVPGRFVVCGALPETYSGKYMRRILRSMVDGDPLGDLGALKNPDCVEPLRDAIGKSGKKAARAPAARSAPARHVPSVDDLTMTVLDAVRSLTGSAAVTPQMPLMDVGLDSLGATHLANQMEEHIGLELSPTVIFEYSTVEALAGHLHALVKGVGGIEVPGALGGMAFAQSEVVEVCATGASVLPNGAAGMKRTWELIAGASNAITEVPALRWEMPGGKLDASTLQRTRHGGFLNNAELFDNARFVISPVEAASMDPQQRLLLEYGYEALHASGLDRTAISQNSVIGVFVGIEANDYKDVLRASPAGTGVYAATGHSLAVASGRMSFALGLQGPCGTYATACSAALVAHHSAMSALQLGECPSAIVQGVNVMLTPGYSISFAIAGMTSPRGRCHTFDRGADGYVRSEACCAAALRTDATTGIFALGSAVRQDGRSASLTAPNGVAQQALIAASLARSLTEPTKLLMQRRTVREQHSETRSRRPRSLPRC